MPSPRSRRPGLALCALALTAGCATSDGRPLPTDADLASATLTVGSKDFTEQHILGEIAVHVLEDNGVEVVNRVGLSGSHNVRELLLQREIDLYWEYTGTAATNYLGLAERFATAEAQYAEVAATDLDRNGVRWLAPAPYNNSYAIATTSEMARRTGVQTLTDFARLVQERPATVDLCVAEEFLTRTDGLPGLQQHYDFDIDAARVHTVPIHDLDRAITRGDRCDFGEVFTTSGNLASLDLTLLDDDQHFFARYHAAVVVRAETASQYPGLVELFGAIAPHLTQDVIIELNRQVEHDGESPAAVASDWLRSLTSQR